MFSESSVTFSLIPSMKCFLSFFIAFVFLQYSHSLAIFVCRGFEFDKKKVNLAVETIDAKINIQNIQTNILVCYLLVKNVPFS